MGKQMSNKEFKQKIYSIFHGSIKPLEVYKGSQKSIKFECEYGHIFKSTPSNVYHHKGNGCTICNKKNRQKSLAWSNSEFLQKLYNIHGDKVKPLQTYTKYKDYMWFECYKGHIFRSTPDTLLHSYYCPCCARKIGAIKTGKKLRKHDKDFLKELHRVHGDKVKPLEKSRGMNVKIWFKCYKGHTFKNTPNTLLRNSYCPICGKLNVSSEMRWSNNTFLKHLHKKYGHEYIPLDVYKGNNTPLHFIHVKCDNIIIRTPKSLLDDNMTCPICKKYIIGYDGEVCVKHFLLKYNIKFQYAKKFNHCRSLQYKRLLHFDFYLPNVGKNGTCIEYNGPQHYHPMKYFSRKKTKKDAIRCFKIQKQHDYLKQKYCSDHNIKLIYIHCPKDEHFKYIKRRVNYVLFKKIM